MKPSRGIPDEFLGVAEELESHRPQLSSLDADRIKLRAMTQGAKTATHTSTKGMFMRSRLAITSMLAFGLLMTSSGAAMGVSALSTSENASVAQYGQQVVPSPTVSSPASRSSDVPEVLGDVAEGNPGTLDDPPEEEDTPGIGVGPASEAPVDRVPPAAVAQASRQLESAGGEQLPFTGYAAVPTLLIGVALLIMGVVLRRRPGRPTG